MNLSNDEIDFIISELDNTSILTEDDMKYIKAVHPQLYYTTKGNRELGVNIYTDKAWVYSLNNTKLNKFICKKFDEPIENLYIIQRLIYGKDDIAQKHKDRFTTHKTVSILLSSHFTGGEMYINDENVSLKNEGDYVVFNGGKDIHEIKKITSGKRDVLVIWFSKKQSKFNII